MKWVWAAVTPYKHAQEGDPENRKMPRMIDPQQGAGWLRHALVLSFYWLLILKEPSQNSYYEAINGTIQCGGDTDTNACIVGGMIGAYVGISGIKQEMIAKVLSFNCENPKETNPEENKSKVGFIRPVLFNTKTRLIPCVRALIAIRVQPGQSAELT